MFLSLFFFLPFTLSFFSLSFFIVFVRKCTKFFVLVMQKLRNFTSFLRSVRAYSLNRILVSFEIVNPEFGRVQRYIPPPRCFLEQNIYPGITGPTKLGYV